MYQIYCTPEYSPGERGGQSYQEAFLTTAQIDELCGTSKVSPNSDQIAEWETEKEALEIVNLLKSGYPDTFSALDLPSGDLNIACDYDVYGCGFFDCGVFGCDREDSEFLWDLIEVDELPPNVKNELHTVGIENLEYYDSFSTMISTHILLNCRFNVCNGILSGVLGNSAPRSRYP